MAGLGSGGVDEAPGGRGPDRAFLVLVVTPSHQVDLDAHVEALRDATGLGAWDARQRLLRPGVALLPLPGKGARTEHGAERCAEVATALRAAGYRACVVREPELRDGPAAPRAVSVAVEDAGITLYDAHGRPLLAVGPGRRVLAVVGDLARAEEDPVRAGEPPVERMLASGQGDPILRLFSDDGAEAVLYARRFNWPSLGRGAGVSAVVNFRHLLDLVREKADEATLDLRFGLADTPPVRPLRLEGVGAVAERFEVHARTCRVLWQEGLLSPLTPEEARGAPPPEEPPPPGPREWAEMADPARHPSLAARRVRDLATHGPPLLVGPLMAGAVCCTLFGFTRPWAFPVGGLAWAALGAVVAFVAWRRRREIQDYPTSRARSVAMGKVELVGRVVPRVTLKTPWTGVDCAWFHAQILVMQRDSRGRERWVTRQSFSSGDLPFLLEDDTGRVLVDPLGATLEVTRTHTLAEPLLPGATRSVASQRGRDTKYVERYLPAGSVVYVLGTARPARREDARGDVVGRLRALKKDAARMAALDVDGNGTVDEAEWEAGVRQVEDEAVRARLDADEAAPAVVVGQGEAGSLFLVSDHDESGVVDRFTRRLWVGVAVGVAGLALAGWSVFPS